jgi:hypothetical protein
MNFSALVEPRQLIHFSLHRHLIDHNMNQLNATYTLTPNSLAYIFNIIPSVSRTFHQKWLSRASHKIPQSDQDDIPILEPVADL